MKRFLLLLLPLILVFQSCRFIGGKRVRGNGNLITQDRSVGSFRSVKSSGFFDVVVANNPVQGVRIEAEDNLQEYIETTIEGDQLTISTRDGYSLRPKRDIKIYVSAPTFSSVQVHGSGNIMSGAPLNNPDKISFGVHGSGDIRVDVNAPAVNADIAGSGTVNVNGETKQFRAEIHGSGDIRAMDLKSEETSVEIAGSGNADVFASVQLNVDVRGSGDVRYKGGANVKSDIKGSGSVTRRD